MKAPKVNYRYLFRDIVGGFCEVEIKKEKLFIKHFSALDQVDLEVLEEKFYNKAKDRGLPTYDETVERLHEEGVWTEKEEGEVKRQKDYIVGAEGARKQLYLKSELDANEAQLKEGRQVLATLLEGKENCIGQTCEKYAKGRVGDHYILYSFYKDKDLTNLRYTDDEISELSLAELKDVIGAYNLNLGLFTDENIQSMTLQDFYSPCYPFCDNVMNFFNKPLFQLSTNQVKLIVFTRMFKNIFENYPKIPQSIRQDASKIIDYVNAQDRAKDVMSNLDKEGASTVMGATQEDYEYMGYKQAGHGKSLSDMLKAKGGKMNMQDLMETMT